MKKHCWMLVSKYGRRPLRKTGILQMPDMRSPSLSFWTQADAKLYLSMCGDWVKSGFDIVKVKIKV